jgi:serralysin
VVRDAQDAVDRADPLAIDVDTDPFSMRPDNLHYDTAGLVALGRAFFGAYQALAGQGVGGEGDDTLQGSDANDHLRGGGGNDLILGAGGFDDINGNMGEDPVRGGAGDDWVLGGKDNDQLSGEEGSDIVNGNLGNDICDGGTGADVIRGGQGDDLVLGGDGDDWLSGDRGSDTLTGGAGADVFHSSGDAGLDRILDFNRGEGDRMLLDRGATYTLVQSGADTVVSLAGGAQVVLVGVQLSALAGDWIVA